MSHLISEDAIAFQPGDATVKSGFESYHSDSFANLRKYYYAVLMHGGKTSADAFCGDDPFKFATVLKKYHESYGKGRAILLISCMVGWAFARPLARAIQIPVLSATSYVSFALEIKGGVTKSGLKALDSDDIKAHGRSGDKFRDEWIFFHPNGQRDVLPGGNFLDENEAILKAKTYVKV